LSGDCSLAAVVAPVLVVAVLIVVLVLVAAVLVVVLVLILVISILIVVLIHDKFLRNLFLRQAAGDSLSQ
jgi:hypothetical protein